MCSPGLAPFHDQWYLAWVGMVPFFLLLATSRSIVEAGAFGLSFGLGYNLVYLSWYLGLQPLDWLNYNQVQGWSMAGFAWVFAATHQALMVMIYAVLFKIIPSAGSFLPVKISGKWKLPALIIMPLLWVLMMNKLLNHSDLMGVPWSMIEYSQYKQSWFIQGASVIGGVGLGFLLVLFNLSLASLLATFNGKSQFKAIAAPNKSSALSHLFVSFLVMALVVVLGELDASKCWKKISNDVGILQSNVNISMQKTKHRYSLSELEEINLGLTSDAKPGLLIWTESSLPVVMKDFPGLSSKLADFARQKKVDMVVGAIDKFDDPKSDDNFNAAFGFSASGQAAQEAYRKRYLVPFGEYAPPILNVFPFARSLTNTPAGKGLSAGRKPVIFKLDSGNVAPLICFECISPELAAESVKAGGQLLVNISDLAWFHQSNVGDQMIAFAVMRAVENRRYLVFAANTGPSVIIDPLGKVRGSHKLDERKLVQGQVGYSNYLSPFTKWFR